MTDKTGNLISRRQVLAGMAGAGVFTIVGTSPVAGALRALAVAGDPDNRVLVNVFLRGGADGLNLVVPHGDDDYYKHRKSIAQAKNTLSDLDGFFGLHSSLSPLHSLYSEGQMAFVQAVGSKDETRSHFSAMDNMDLAFGNTGWMQRALVANSERDSLAGLTIGNQAGPALRGPNSGIAYKRLYKFRQASAALDEMRPTLEAMYGGSVDPLIGQATLQGFTSIDRLTGVSVNPSVTYPKTAIATDLKEAAALIKANLGVRMVSINFGGWDHHRDENSKLENRSGQLAEALVAFKADLAGDSGRVLTMVMSEFGRTARENGSGGTDHGHGNMMMLMGGGLASQGGGKVHLRNNRWVGLSSSQLHGNRDLAITTDFRSVLAEALERHMGITDNGTIFPGYRPDYLGILPGGSVPPPTTTTTVPASTTTSLVATTIPTTTRPSTSTTRRTTTTRPPSSTTTSTRPSTSTTRPTTTRPPTTLPSTTTTRPAVELGSVAGVVSFVNGEPVAGVQIDLFKSVDGKRNGFLGSTKTDANGRYSFTAEAGPYVLTFIAIEGDSFVAGGRYHQPSVRIVGGEATAGVNAQLLGSSLSGTALIGGTVSRGGAGVKGATIDLFVAKSDGSRGRFLSSTSTGPSGGYEFAAPASCYVVTMVAPDERLFTNGRRWNQVGICVERGESVTDLNGELE